MVPGFTGLGAPYWNPQARGALVGLTRGTTSSHIIRAALEVQAYQTLDLMHAMAEDARHTIAEFCVDGGMVKNNWVCQFLADMMGKSVLRTATVETTAFGAAYLAGLHMKTFCSLSDIQNAWACEHKFISTMTLDIQQKLYAGWQHAVRQALA